MKKILIAIIIILVLFLLVGNVIVATSPDEERKEFVSVKNQHYSLFVIEGEDSEPVELCYTPKEKE